MVGVVNDAAPIDSYRWHCPTRVHDLIWAVMVECIVRIVKKILHSD